MTPLGIDLGRLLIGGGLAVFGALGLRRVVIVDRRERAADPRLRPDA